MNPIKILIFVLSLIFIIISCEKEKIVEKEVLTEPQLIVSADTLIFNNEEAKELFLSTKPAAESEFQIISSPDWVKVNPESGIIKSDIKEISITSIFSGMEAGVFSDELIIMSTSGNDTVKLIGLLGEQLLYSTPDPIHFSVSNNSKSFILKNLGSVTINYSLTASSNYIDFKTQSGEILVGKQKEITINLNREVMETGSFLSEIYLKINEVTETIVVKTDNLPLYTFPDSIKFSTFSDSEKLIIKNKGSVSLSYNLSASDSYIDLPSESGEVLVGEQKEILVNVNKASLETGSFFSEIYININEVEDTVAVLVESFKEQKHYLSSDVVDAEYVKSTNLLVYVSSSPSQLNIFNTKSDSLETISLIYVPTCLSIAPDGETVVVGHDGHITLVDLNLKSVIKTTNVSCQAFDIVLSSENWAYVFPEEDQWEKIRCIDLDTEIEKESTGNQIYENTRARLHPSGKYIYTAEDDLEKFDITSGTANYLYDSPYHYDYPINNNLWFSEDGIRIFTEGGSVFITSEIENTDLLYNGTISIGGQYYNKMVWLDHSGLSDNLFVLKTGDGYNEPNTPNVSIYNATNLVFKEKIELEKFLVLDSFGGGTFYNPEPYFVFSNSSLKEIYVLSKANGSGLLYEWAIEKVSYE